MAGKLPTVSWRRRHRVRVGDLCFGVELYGSGTLDAGERSGHVDEQSR